eukprot:4053563-Alexandrium_andersonii.AAC.1
MAKPAFPEAFVLRSLRPPPGQGALHVQTLPAARAARRNCTCGGPGARARSRRPIGPFQLPDLGRPRNPLPSGTARQH